MDIHGKKQHFMSGKCKGPEARLCLTRKGSKSREMKGRVSEEEVKK